MNEEQIEQVARRLGARAAASIDVDRTADAVLARLRTADRVARPWHTSVLLRVAAVVVLAVGTVWYGYRATRDAGLPNMALASAPVASLGALSADELGEVLDSLAVQAPSSEVVPGLHDLSTEQLAELLQQMEG